MEDYCVSFCQISTMYAALRGACLVILLSFMGFSTSLCVFTVK